MRTLLLGTMLTAVVAVALGLVFGRGAGSSAVLAGALATVVQVAAGWAHRRWPAPPRAVIGQGYVIGFLVRLAGVAVFALVAGLRPDLMMPLPAALAFTGVLFPLMIMETRAGR